MIATIADLDGNWKVTELNEQKLDPEQSRQVLQFDILRRHLSGNAGCNRMTGSIEYNEAMPNIIKFSQVATTRMACPNMKSENEFLGTLAKVVRFQKTDEAKPIHSIVFFGTDNKPLMVIEKQ
ncbi:META domain-containing protein [Parabacteroides sp. PF5-9]|uniref:META domain-containing protein n=1 Tax=Parabacteroides sp. PF5-9 TaxID=1742404 RepID=UPI002475712E|nr:META domain-containing protein [Parabacteroides sp. PF5-9]